MNENMINLPPIEIILKIEELTKWSNERQQKYGNITSQLDILWHDIDDGFFGENAKNGNWFKNIKNIKEEHFKPDIERLEEELKQLIQQNEIQ